MAFTYESKPVLSKIKIGENYYYLKDADLRSIVDSFNKDIVLGSIGGMNEEDKFVYSQNIKKYVDDLVAVGLVIEVVDELPIASKDTTGKIYLVPHSHEESSDIKDEYITYNSGTEEAPVYTWEKIGNTDIDLSGYVSDVKYENKTLKMQKGKGAYADVHIFGDFADANSGEGKVDTADSALFAYTPSGTVNVTLKDSTTATEISSTGSYTPAGTVNGDAIKGGSIDVTLGDATADTNATVSYDAYTPAGEVSAPTITLTPSTKNVSVVKTNGTLPSFTEGAFTPASIGDGFFNAGAVATYTHSGFSGGSLASASKDTFAKEGILASVGTGDDAETLIISNASTANAVTEQGAFTAAVYGTDTFNGGTLPSIDKTKFNGGSKAVDTWSAGALPTLETQSVMQSATAKATAPTFTGTEVSGMKVTGVTYKKQVVASKSFTPEAATLSFTGTAGDVSVTGSYNKQEIDKKEFTGNAATGNEVTLNKTEKTVIVNPK